MEIQTDVYVIIILTILLSILILVAAHKIDKLDPLAKPKGFAAAVLLGVMKVRQTCVENAGEKIGEKLTPYIVVLWVYIFSANIISLFGLESPTANLSVTLLLAFITWVLIQIVEFKFGGVKAYFHSFIEPLPVMLPMNIIGKFSTMVSMSLRLFGNITCGGIMMQLVYIATQLLSNKIVDLITNSSITVFNFMGPILAPLLHAYFDVFSGFVQTLVFVTLTVVLIGNDIPEEVKQQKEVQLRSIQA
jgi:F-type H+-transporting ATPase subunit a